MRAAEAQTNLRSQRSLDRTITARTQKVDIVEYITCYIHFCTFFSSVQVKLNSATFII